MIDDGGGQSEPGELEPIKLAESAPNHKLCDRGVALVRLRASSLESSAAESTGQPAALFRRFAEHFMSDSLCKHST